MLKHAFLEIESSDQLLKKGEKKTKAKTMSIMVNLVSFVFKILLKLDRISICNSGELNSFQTRMKSF